MKKMNNKQIAAVAAVVIILIATVCAYTALKGPEPEEKGIEASLPVYGNANDDYIVDDEDISIMESIMKGDKSLADYPLADADLDGKVTSKDIEIATKLKNGESTMCTIVDQLDRKVTLQYPLDNMIAIRSDVATFMACGGFQDHVYGYTGTDYVNIYEGIKKAGGQYMGNSSSVSADIWAKIVKADSDLNAKGEKVGAVISDRTTAFGDYLDDMDTAKIPAICIRVTDPDLTLSGTLLIGFLVGGECYEQCQDYVRLCEEAMSYLHSKTDNLSDDEVVRFISMISIRCVSGDESQYSKTGEAAGGKCMTKIKGDTSPSLQTVDAITEYDDLITQILAFRTMGCTVTDLSNTCWGANTIGYVENSKWFEGMVFINCSMPVTCRVLYAANVLYPELIDESYADSILQKIVDEFLPYLHDTQEDGHFDVTKDMTTTVTYQDYQDYLKSH